MKRTLKRCHCYCICHTPGIREAGAAFGTFACQTQTRAGICGPCRKCNRKEATR